MNEAAQSFHRFDEVEDEGGPQMEEALADRLEIERERHRRRRKTQRRQRLLHGIDLDQHVLLVRCGIGRDLTIIDGDPRGTMRSYRHDHAGYSAAIETPALPHRWRA